VEIDFSDAELFVLSGPMGSGKSSVIDAMTFALYGAVPRHGKHATSAIVSKGKNRTRVRLDFAVAGAQYTAVRGVTVTAGGNATTSEARLERADEVLADNARDLTDAVEKLVGLSFDHFTQCVVLPQGAFQDFLKATPANRQDMLIQLLDLGIYDQVKKVASDRATRAEAQANALKVILEQQYGHVSKDAVDEAKERAKEIDALAKSLKKKRQDIENRRRAAREATEAVRQLSGQIGVLAKVAIPEGVDDLVNRIEKGEEALAAAEKERSEADKTLDAADAKKNELGEKSARESVLDKHAKLEQIAGSVAELEQNLEKAKGDKVAAEQIDAEAEGQFSEASKGLSGARERNSAAALASSLTLGAPCPVCLQEVHALPEHDADLDFQELESAVARAQGELSKARSKATQAAANVASAQSALESSRKQVKELEKELKGAAEPKQLRKEIQQIAKAQEAWSAARKARDAAVSKLNGTKDKVEALRKARVEAWGAFEEAQAEVFELKPPKKKADDLPGSWTALHEWAGVKAKELEQEFEHAKKQQEEARTSEDALLQEVGAEMLEAGLEMRKDESPFDAVDEANAEARTAVKQLEENLETAKKKRKELGEIEGQRRTAEALSQLLRASQFENWLLGRALRSLTGSATRILNELTSGAYSLSVSDNNDFAVVDHLNANEVRSAATLSGGETFLASLALALALADQVAQLAAKGTSKLEALFLDEGFGTLDPETLDVVATTLEELGAQGRMIGVITHVRELADRLPVRFDLKKEGNVSSITRAA
jgi:exonuclease SbcC